MRLLTILLFSCLGYTYLMADESMIIDNRSSGSLESTLGGEWRLITDRVMGGASSGNLAEDSIEGKPCMRLSGNVRLDNSGGFIQAALDVQGTEATDVSGYQGLLLKVFGNDKEYNLHLRTKDVWLPWQSYRASFHAPAHWQSVKVPFTSFTPYRIGKKLDLKHLKRIGIVAIGQEFTADLCIANLSLYKDTH